MLQFFWSSKLHIYNAFNLFIREELKEAILTDNLVCSSLLMSSIIMYMAKLEYFSFLYFFLMKVRDFNIPLKFLFVYILTIDYHITCYLSYEIFHI